MLLIQSYVFSRSWSNELYVYYVVKVYVIAFIISDSTVEHTVKANDIITSVSLCGFISAFGSTVTKNGAKEGAAYYILRHWLLS